jgi:hypothetical protein
MTSLADVRGRHTEVKVDGGSSVVSPFYCMCRGFVKNTAVNFWEGRR